MTSGSTLGSSILPSSLQAWLVPVCVGVATVSASQRESEHGQPDRLSLPLCWVSRVAQHRSCCQAQLWHCMCMQGPAAEVAVMTRELSRLADEMLPKGETAGDDSGELGSLSQRLKASWDNKVGSVVLLDCPSDNKGGFYHPCSIPQGPGTAAHCGASCLACQAGLVCCALKITESPDTMPPSQPVALKEEQPQADAPGLHGTCAAVAAELL